MFWIQSLLMFVFSVSNDWLSVAWHEARENNRPVKGAVMGVLLGIISWLSIIWVVADSRWLMVPDLIGTAVGSYYGIKHHHYPLWKATPGGLLLQLMGLTNRENKEEE